MLFFIPVNSFEYGFECANQLLDDNYALDAMIAFVDVQGLGARRAIKERGIGSSQIKIVIPASEYRAT